MFFRRFKSALLILLIGASSPAAVTYPQLIWKKKVIRVCFGNIEHIGFSTWGESRDSFVVRQEAKIAESEQRPVLDLSPSTQQNVRTWVETQMEQAKLGTQFTGFEPCQDAAQAPDLMVFVYLGNLHLGSSSRLGAGYRVYPPHAPPRAGLTPAVVLDFGVLRKFAWNQKLHQQYSVLHEFAHVLGLSHEHDRPEALKDRNCRRSRTDLQRIREPISEMAVLSPEYDPQSITNYCWVNVVQVSKDPKVGSWIPHWSALDVLTLQQLYP